MVRSPAEVRQTRRMIGRTYEIHVARARSTGSRRSLRPHPQPRRSAPACAVSVSTACTGMNASAQPSLNRAPLCSGMAVHEPAS